MNLNAFECLDLENYATWSEKMRFILEHERLVKFIDEDDHFIRELVKTDAGKRGEKAAQSIIAATVDDRLYGKVIAQCKSAKEMWLTLHSLQMDFDCTFVLRESTQQSNSETTSENLSLYDEGLYVRPPDKLKAQLYQLKLRLRTLQQEIIDGRKRAESRRPRCCFCYSKVHSSDKCWQLKNVKLTSSAHLCSLM